MADDLYKRPKSMEEFEQILAEAKTSDKLYVLQFSASWCGPCNAIEGDLEDLTKELKDTVQFVFVDADDVEEAQEQWEIVNMPTFVALKKGEKQELYSGNKMDKIKEYVAKHAA
uniref:Thioredoxin domain-containing protein n=1 Tax=Strombidinopsis acuminata TaxID=141414 RepID=A0A7S3RZ36_9SPIT|mmetsp:Transcript_16239/g.22236  ORF Transcript_16239/g.22236 Transcript_16239/m.22236 type:complete len:114 (+) Transcript_16239:41-382(+)